MDMSSVNWSEVLAIFAGFGAFFIYLMSRLDGLRRDFDGLRKDFDDKIGALQKDINRIDSKVSNIEGQITQMTRPNIVPMQRHQRDNDLKEN